MDEIRYKLAQVEEKQRKLENLWLNSICSASLPSTLSREKGTSSPVTEGANSLRNRRVRIAVNTVHFDSSGSVSPNVSPDSVNVGDSATESSLSKSSQQRLQN